jgi:hypothetical protein
MLYFGLMKRVALAVAALVGILLTQYSIAYAQYNSTNYKAEEAQFGSGGELDSSSANYKGQTSVGGLTVDHFSSTNYQSYSGFITPNDPFLEMTVSTSSVNLGTLDASTPKTGTALFQVRGYTDSGYTVQSLSTTLTNDHGDTITAINPAAGSSPGTEQFGFNLVHNTSPVTFGTNPAPQPDSS